MKLSTKESWMPAPDYGRSLEGLTINLLVRDVAAALAGRKPPRVRLPHGLILPFAYAAEGIARLTGREPFATVDGIRMARKKMYFSSAKARESLGYQPRPALEALRDAVEWFRTNGYLD